MVFSSFTFLLCFVPLFFLVYYLMPERGKNYVLLIGSLLFYAWGEPVYVILLLLSITANYALAGRIGHAVLLSQTGRAKANLVFAVVWNLAVIGFFKYYGFLASGVNALIPHLLPSLKLSLPIGISFYTFQAMSYVFDVYKKKIRAQKSWFTFAMYVSMFPQVTSGPIVRYGDIAQEIRHRRITLPEVGAGCEQLIRGLAKKLLFANAFGQTFTSIQALGASDRSVLVLWLGAISYTLQIYFDFSGYSDMAIGLARMMGFHFKPNFDHPYVATSVTDFWRRWHISLSTWFRDYVYIPLGGNRRGRLIQIRNLLIVWMLTGLWHGAGVNFICWGLYYGVLLILEKFVLQRFMSNRVFAGVYRIFTLAAVVVGWMLFAHTDASALFAYLGGMFGIGSVKLAGSAFWHYLSMNAVLLVAGCVCATPLVHNFKNYLIKSHATAAAALNVLLLFLCMAVLVYQSYSPFLYFQF